MACEPDVLILNGPTVGVDIGSKHDIHDILKKQAKAGMGIIIISDDLPEVLSTCSRVLVIKNGKIVDEMNAQQATEAEILEKMM
jgi:simple sugar transport system ATP-binding protein